MLRDAHLCSPILLFQVQPYNEARVVALRNRETLGKDYNIVTGVRFEHFPPSLGTEPRTPHPSITATTKLVDR